MIFKLSQQTLERNFLSVFKGIFKQKNQSPKTMKNFHTWSSKDKHFPFKMGNKEGMTTLPTHIQLYSEIFFREWVKGSLAPWSTSIVCPAYYPSQTPVCWNFGHYSLGTSISSPCCGTVRLQGTACTILLLHV